MARPELPPYEPRAPGAPKAIEGVRVLDFTSFISGPFGTMLLADLGADVLKIEAPLTGDDSRGLKPPALAGESSLHVWANRNKRSIVLDLRLPEAQRVARALAAQSDVVVENYSAGIMERFGLSYAALAQDNPGLIHCSISAFGRNGVFASRPAFDPVAQAESGFLSLNGYPDQEPLRAGASVVDITSGMMTCNAILAALFARSRSGVGQQVEVVMFDVGVALTGQYGMNYLMTGEEQLPRGNGSNTAEPVGLFAAKDGPLFIACANDRTFRRLARDVLRRPEMARDADYLTNEDRMRNRLRLHARLKELVAEEPRAVWLERGHAAGLPIGLPRKVSEAYSSAEMRACKLLSEIPHPTAGRVPNVAPPFHFSGTPIVDPVAAPLLGQHTDEVLTAVLGYDAAELARLRAAGVFGTAVGRD